MSKQKWVWLLALGAAGLTACDDPTGSKRPGTVSNTGGTITAASGNVVLVFPPGAVSSDVKITVEPNTHTLQDARLVPGTAYDFGPDGIQFAQPVQVSIRYAPAQIPGGASEFSLVLHKAVGGRWQAVASSSVDIDKDVVTASISSFSTYAILSVPVNTVSIAPDSSQIPTGETVQLAATLRDVADNTLTGRSVTWTSSDTSIATVSESGLVKGVGIGTVTITATSEQKAATAPVMVSPKAALSMAVGAGHSCALIATGAAYCWGRNFSGQLGTGFTAGTHVPVAVSGGLTFSAISAGFNTTCAITARAAAYCWGGNFQGEFGDGTTTSSSTPTAVSGGLRFASISVGGRGHVCGLTTTGAAYCWGENRQGQLGTGDTIASTTPAAVSGGLTFRSISAGAAHTCAVATDGAGYCWGLNNRSQLGTGNTEPQIRAPARVTGGLVFTSLNSGVTVSCGTTNAGTYCWGTNLAGSLGNGSTTESSTTTPAKVTGGVSFASVHPGDEATSFAPVCALTRNGAAYCWGSNSSGQLGTASTPSTCRLGANISGCTSTPIPVSGDLTFEVVVPGGEHTCGITRDDRAYCWGNNGVGQLGNGSTTPSNTPVVVARGLRFP